jgi:hypothetical protein
MLELVLVAWQVHHLNAVSIQVSAVDLLFSLYQRVRRTIRLNVDLSLEAFEIMPVGI